MLLIFRHLLYNMLMTKEDRKFVKKTVKVIVDNYGETLKKLAKCQAAFFRLGAGYFSGGLQGARF